ncbi:MAG: acyl-CoA thioesterase [Lentisphaerae bacterium]|jgi:acyl-CoA thioester hydrolase|nr:acyl-CoA thioesterase [Lentisphaerota bacterium]
MSAQWFGQLEYRVPYADTDQMGVVYYANYLVYFERSRNELMRAMGLTYKELEQRQLGLPVVSAHIDYKTPARYDDLLTIRAELAWIRGVRLQVDCSVRRAEQVLATGYTIHAVIDLHSLRPARLPDELMAMWSQAVVTAQEQPTIVHNV